MIRFCKENAAKLALEYKLKHTLPILPFLPLMDLACIVAEFEVNCSLAFWFEEELLKYIFQRGDAVIQELLACDDAFVKEYTQNLILVSRKRYHNEHDSADQHILSRVFIILDCCNRPDCYYSLHRRCACTRPLTSSFLRSNSLHYRLIL